jgi:ABC-type uncharacterized transport system auxiliary subunit
MNTRYRLHALTLFALPLLFTGCLGAAPRAQQRAAAQKRTFLPLVSPAAAQAAAPRFAPVKIRGFRALPPFDASGFIIRRPNSEFTADFYNAWLVPPQDLIRNQTARYLEQTGLFSAVYDAASGTLPPLSLEGVISELYLDCSGDTPAAVVTLRLLVLDERAAAFTVLFSAERSGRAPYDASDKSSPAQAFGQALTQALAALTQALADAPPEPFCARAVSRP